MPGSPMLRDNDAPRPQLARSVRPRARRSSYARRETYTRVLSAMIMVGVMVTWVWIFGVVAKRRTERPVEQDEISSPAASDEPEALAVNSAPPTPQSIAAPRESSDVKDAIPTAPP